MDGFGNEETIIVIAATNSHTPPIQSWPFDFAFEGLMPPGETGFSLLSSAMQGMRNRPPIKERTQVNV